MRHGLIGLLLLLVGCAGLPPTRGDPPLPFARVQDIPMEGAAVRPAGCSGEIGVNLVTADGAYQILLHRDRALIVDNRPGDELPVWFVEVDEERAFRLAFVLPFADAQRRYPDPCAWLRPMGTPSTLKVFLNSSVKQAAWASWGTSPMPFPARMPRTRSGGA